MFFCTVSGEGLEKESVLEYDFQCALAVVEGLSVHPLLCFGQTAAVGIKNRNKNVTNEVV